ncbi:hypothetical protein [Pseudanabaena sp. lw0831]|uniref:hypothetical protein n=1 Tax=Pseudanabaena sp. lw0831 TaxID=1357935 RepID=UPI0019151CF4|nr:hypothetical protein [Pseudanabaena sp. lw0831]
MAQLSVMDLAKQGDPNAIASLINRSLASKGIHAEAELEAECLRISLQASQIPNQKAVVTIIHRGMIVLQVSQIKRVKILTYRSDNHYLAWQDEIDLGNNDDLKQSVATPTIIKDTNVEQGQNMNLVSNPKGVILVQKLSQIQQNLQEYQDIIVRFTDEHVGTVRCLTTLTELIQVISQPSFLFASVASNPNLRSLLDTIAESSKTDQHGDQVITNLSILQPGQQWQKAKIRLVTKIFLEPADLSQDQNEPEVTHQGLTLDLTESTPESIADEPDIELDNASPEIEQDNSEDVIANLGSESNSQMLTVNSLFDDFPEPPLPSAQSVQIVNDITENSDFSDSLFDDFMNVDSANSYRESEDLSIQQVNEETKPTNVDDDLFGNFSSNDNSDIDDLEDDIEAIKLRIPKQNLDKFLQIMDEEEQIKAKSETINNKKDIDKDTVQVKPDLGATTIERILGNMETITLSGLDSKSSSNFVTLEDFAEDLNSVGF